MKSMKYLAVVSAIMLAMTGCDKKERPAQNAEKPKTTQNQPAEPTVTPKEADKAPAVVCDASDLESRVLSLVRDDLLKSSISALNKPANTADLAEVLRVKLSTLTIELDEVQEKGGQCNAKLHIVLPEADVANADKVFAQAGLSSLAEQASEQGLELMNGSRLVGDFTYKVDGESLLVQSNNSAVKIASQGLATAVISQAKPVATKPSPSNAQQTVATPIRPTPRPVEPVVTPIRPTPRPAQPTAPQAEPRRVAPAPSTSSNNNSANNSNAGESVQKPVVRTDEKPKSAPKPESAPAPKPESAPASTPAHKSVSDESSEITIVESDDTY